MLGLREDAITRILEAAYMILDRVLKGPTCKQEPPSEVGCRCMILGSYTSFLVANNLYPQYKKATDVTMSLQEFSAMLNTLSLVTYESHDYSTIHKQAKQIVVHSYGETTSSSIKRHLVGNGLKEHKTCGRMVDIVRQAERICETIPFPTLDELRIHMSNQAEK